MNSAVRGQLYILGTSHPLQCGSPECSLKHIAAFETKLRSICDSYNIICIAEEMSQEGLSEHTVTETVAEKLAKSQGIRHHYVDLTSQERAELSFDEAAMVKTVTSIGFKDAGGNFRCAFDKTRDEVRERCWTARILAKQQWPTLLICGSDHSENMHALWSRFGLNAVIVHKGYEP